MGWLSVNIRNSRRSLKRRATDKDTKNNKTKPHKKTRSVVPPSNSKKPFNSPQNDADSQVNHHISPLEKLSSDILKQLLVLSGNLSLPQASHLLARKLKRSKHLEMALVREQLRGTSLPIIPAMRWPFITVELLEFLRVSNFIGNEQSVSLKKSIDETITNSPFVPHSIENQIEKYHELISYMIRRGCRVENSTKVYEEMAAKQDWEAVKALVKGSHRATVNTIVMALQSGQSAEFVIELLNVTPEIKSDWSSKWNVQQAAISARVPQVNSYLNTR